MRKLIVALACVTACTPKFVPTPVVTTPRFPDFVAPAVPSGFADTLASRTQDRGWAFLQTGDLKNAEREFSVALIVAPAFYPSEVSLGYVELARLDFKAALSRFDRLLMRHPGDAAVLVARGHALIGLGRDSDAIAAFESALAADPAFAGLTRRIDVLKFRTQEQNLARARQAARAGSFDEAVLAYATAIAASPESPFLYRELAEVERRTGDADAALVHLRRAIALDPGDVRSRVGIGEILVSRNDLPGAAEAYADALAIESNPDVAARLDAVRARAEEARLPEAFRTIDRAPEITRADLAALIGVRLSWLLPPPERRGSILVSDVNNHWASPWIIAVAAAGVMEPFANHTFQPETIVRRIDFAETVNRLLAQIAARTPNRATSWASARLKFPDLSASHLAYDAASQTVAAGVLKTEPDGNFQPSKPVTGSEAFEAIARLEALAGARIPAKGPR